MPRIGARSSKSAQPLPAKGATTATRRRPDNRPAGTRTPSDATTSITANSRSRGSPSGRAASRCFRSPRRWSRSSSCVPARSTSCRRCRRWAAPWCWLASRSCSPSAPAIVIWREGVGGGRHAVTALFIGLALIAYPLYLGIKASQLPAIYDITTDPIDPPRFDAIARLRPRDANPVTYAGLYAAEQQHTAYSDIEPDDTTSTPQEAYDAAMKVITKRKWRVVDARPPQGPPQAPLPRIIDARAAPRRSRARRHYRGGGAHADPRLSRRRRGAGARDHRRRPHRCALGLALRPPRSRHQCQTGAQSHRRYRRRLGVAAAGEEDAAAGSGSRQGRLAKR